MNSALYSIALTIATLLTSIGLTFPQDTSHSPRMGFFEAAKQVIRTVSDAPKFEDGHDLLVPGTATVGEARHYTDGDNYYVTEEICPTNPTAGITFNTRGQFMFVQANVQRKGTNTDVPATVHADGRLVHSGLLPRTFHDVQISGAQKVTIKSEDPTFCLHAADFKRWK